MLLAGLGTSVMPDSQTLELRLPPNVIPETPATTGRQETCFDPLRFPFVGVRHKPGPGVAVPMVMPEGGGEMWPCEVSGTGDLIVDHVLGIGLWALVLSSLFRRQ